MKFDTTLNFDYLYYQLDEDGLAFMDKDGKVLQEELHKVSGWRGLFDSCCSEWNDSEMTDKVRVIKLAKQVFECSFGFLIFLYVKDCLSQENYYRLWAVTHAVYELSEYDIDIEDYLKRCSHSLFHRAPGKSPHWKEAIVRELIDGDGRPLWADDLDGLLLENQT